MESLMNQLPPPQRDEYDVVIANLDDCGQFFIRQTYGPLYSTEFVDYERRSDGRQNPARNCKAFHRRGDVVVAVDGIWTKGKPFEEVVAMIQESTNNKYMFLRMASAKHNDVDNDASLDFSLRRPNKEELQDDITWWAHALEKKEEQLEVIRQELAARKEALAELETSDEHSSRSNTLSVLSPSSTTPANKIPDSSHDNESVRRSRRLKMKKRNLGFVSPPGSYTESPARVNNRDNSLGHGNRRGKKRCA